MTAVSPRIEAALLLNEHAIDAIYTSDSIFERLPKRTRIFTDNHGTQMLMAEYDRLALGAVLFDVSRLLVKEIYVSSTLFPFTSLIDRFTGAMQATTEQMNLLNTEQFKSSDDALQTFKLHFTHALKSRGVTNPIEIATFLRVQALLQLRLIVIEKWCTKKTIPEIEDVHAALSQPVCFLRFADLFHRRPAPQISPEVSKPILKLIANPGFNPRQLWAPSHSLHKKGFGLKYTVAMKRIRPENARRLLLSKIEENLPL